MRKLQVLLLLHVCLCLGCDKATEPVDRKVQSSEDIVLVSARPIALDGGLKYSYNGDSIVVYEMSEALGIRNNSKRPLTMNVRCELGTIIDSQFSAYAGYLGWGDSTNPLIRYDTTIAPGDSLIFHSSIIELGRTAPLDWRFPYAYLVTCFMADDTVQFYNTFEGATAENCFNGFVRTSATESDTLIGGDDGDWFSANPEVVWLEPARPNPSLGAIMKFKMNIMLALDSIKYEIYETKHRIVWQLSEGMQPTGEYTVNIMPVLKRRGLYRLIVTGKRDGKYYKIHGDIASN